MAVCVVCKLLNIVCGLFSWRLCVYKQRKDNTTAPQTAVQYMLSLGKTANGQTASNYGSTESIVGELNREQTADQTISSSNPAAESSNNDL